MFYSGQKIGLYHLIRKLGRGGFGEVWLAEKRTQFVTKKVAVKLPHDDQINFDSIRQEATLWEQASGHPNVLPIIDADVCDNQVIIVSEYAEGGSLADRIKTEGRLPLARAIEMTIGILSGLEYLHGKQIIHRDIKPQNILLQGDTPRLADFGISRAMNPSTISSAIIGTDAYMAPEAFQGKRNVQTDIWSVGVLMYALLADNLPFPQEHPSERMYAILMNTPEPLSSEVPQKLKEIAQKALAKLPENRYQSAKEMREELQKELIAINHPTFAPTEILRRPAAQDFQAKAPLTIEPDAPTVQTSEPRIQADQTEKLPEYKNPDFIKPTQPAVHLNAPPADKASASSIATQFKEFRQMNNPNPLPTQAQAFADNKRASRKDNAARYYAGAGIGGLLLIAVLITIIIVSNSSNNALSVNASKPANTANPTNTANLTNTTANVQSNTSTSSLFGEGVLIPYRKGEKWGFVDGNKKTVIEPKYEDAIPFSEDLASVESNGKWGFIDKTGNEVIPFKYDFSGWFNDGLASVIIKKGNNDLNFCCYGFIDKTGNEVIPFKLRDARPFYEGLAVMACGWRNGFIDTTGKQAIPCKYADVEDFSEGLAKVEFDPDYEKNLAKGYINTAKAGFIDKTGKTIIPLKYWRARSFSENLAAVSMNGPWGFIDKSGSQVIAFKYDDAGDFSEGLAPVELKEIWGFIDKTGAEIIPFKFKYPHSFSEGLATVQFNGKWGFIDKNGKEVIPFKYDDTNDFHNGLANVTLNKKDFYIDKNGTEYYEP